METTARRPSGAVLQALPGDDARQIMWRFVGRRDLRELIASARSVARGPVARLVAAGGRSSHEWTERKAALLDEFDRAGITRVYLEPSEGGFLEGPRNLALALVAFELAWVDAGAATAMLGQYLALAPIRERGTDEQRQRYMRAAGGAAGQPWRGAFALTEPIPHVGVDTGLLGGKVRVAEWKPGEEPLLHVEKRGRFITNMEFAGFVTAAVQSADARISGTCLVTVHEDDPGVFDRGEPTRKLIHQLSSTSDPVFSVTVPASRMVGGFTVRDGVIIPNFDHTEILEAVFRRTRVTVSLMTPAKLVSAVEPVLRYQRDRFRGSEARPGTPRYELGLQQRQDALHRLIDVWAAGEAGASLGFAAARAFDDLEALDARKRAILAEAGVTGRAGEQKALRRRRKDAIQYLRLSSRPKHLRDNARLEQLAKDDLVRFVVADSETSVLGPACKLWNTGRGATMMREAVSLMGGLGITEDCPGFLGYKWMDTQLEATWEGPEAVQRRLLSLALTNEVFLARFDGWVAEMRELAARRPGTGACTLASAMELWAWTLRHLRRAADAEGDALYHGPRQGVTFPLADALCWLLASRCQILDVLALEAEGPSKSELAETLPGMIQFFNDLAHVHAARAAAETGSIAAELVHGYNRHPAWDSDDCACCYREDDLAALEQIIPGIESSAGGIADVIAADGRHALKAGPCVQFKGLDEFVRLRGRLDGCLTGARLAKDRAAEALTAVAIPAALDYPRPAE